MLVKNDHILIVVLFHLFITFTAKAQWILQSSGTYRNLNAISFIDSTQGWIVGDSGTILHTSDAGYTWNIQDAGVTINLSGVSFCDKKNGWIIGNRGTIMKTDNGGNVWQRIQHDTSHIVRNYKVQCLSPSTIFILRDRFLGDYWADELIWRTLDSGQTWDNISPSQFQNSELMDMQFLNSSLGWICGSSGIQTFHTIFNNDFSWSRDTFNHTTLGRLSKIIFDDSLHGWVTDGDSIYSSSDGGNTWNTTGLLQLYDISDLYKHGLLGYASGGQIKKTVDGGITWSSQILPVGPISFITPDIGWAIGGNGIIYHTENGGTASIKNEINKLPSEFYLCQNYPNPFNPSTRISFFIPKQLFVILEVFDILGRKIETLVNVNYSSGWHSIEWFPQNICSGIYFYKIGAGTYSETKKLLYQK